MLWLRQYTLVPPLPGFIAGSAQAIPTQHPMHVTAVTDDTKYALQEPTQEITDMY